MLHTYKYLFTSAEERNNALLAAYPEREEDGSFYPQWDENGSSTQTLEGGDSVIILGQNFDNTDPENPIALNEWCVDIVSTEINSSLDSYLVTPQTPNHQVLGISDYVGVIS